MIRLSSGMIDIIRDEKYSTSVLPDRASIQRAFGRILAMKRRSAKLSQADFGKLVGLSRTSITNIERGRQAIQLHQLYEFASMLEVPVAEMLPILTEPTQSRAHDVVPKNLETQTYLERLRQLPVFERPARTATRKTGRR